MTREAIPKKLRFEVFKRDSFRCQYCGASAPEVFLEVDHVMPIAKGGKTDILNLITSCKPCNAGKGKRPLSDSTTISKQLDQLKELNERREQLEMMIRWKEGLSNLKEESLSRVGQFWSKSVPGYSLTEHGKRELKKLSNRFELQEIMDAIQIATDQYLTYDRTGKIQKESIETAWEKVSGICQIRRVEKSKPFIRDLLYIRGILRKRIYVNERYIMELLESAVNAGADLEALKECARKCPSWTSFREEVESFINETTFAEPAKP